MEKEFDLGKCCCCESDEKPVLNILMLHHKAPESGKGWGCVICNIPSDGAIAVLCDDCFADEKVEVKFLCLGYPGDKKRVPFSDDIKATMFDHILSLHPERLAELN